MEVEDVSGVGLTSGRATEEEGHLTVGDGLLGQIVEDDEGVLAVVTEPLSDGGSGEGGEVLEGSGLGGGSGDDDGVLHGVVLLKGLDELRDGGALLSDGDVDAVELGGIIGAVVPPPLVEDRVEGDGGLAGLPVSDDQLTLATSNGHHGVDRLEAGQHGLGDRGTGKDSGRLDLGTAALDGVDRALAVDGVSESVDDTAEESRADGDVDDVSGTLDAVALLAANEARVSISGRAPSLPSPFTDSSPAPRLLPQAWPIRPEKKSKDLHETIVSEDGDSDVVYERGIEKSGRAVDVPSVGRRAYRPPSSSTCRGRRTRTQPSPQLNTIKHKTSAPWREKGPSARADPSPPNRVEGTRQTLDVAETVDTGGERTMSGPSQGYEKVEAGFTGRFHLRW